MNKCHTNIGWHNDTTPAINETNLNYMDGCIDTLDDRVISLDTTKAEQSDLLTALSNVTYNTSTGVFTFTWKNGTTVTFDLNIEKIPVSFSMDANGVITMTTADGTTYTADVSAILKTYSFTNSSTIGWTVTQNGNNFTVVADIVDGSITANKLQPNYLADVTAQANIASAAASSANTDQLKAEGFANGTQGGVPVTSGSPYYENNAKYWKEQAQAIAGNTFAGLTDVDFNSLQDGQIPVYNSSSQEWENQDAPKGLLPHIIISIDTESTVTITKGGTTITATETSTGVYEADVDSYGAWTANAVKGVQSGATAINVDTVKIYNATITWFSATITVNYPNNMRGESFTCVKDGITLTETAPSGANTFNFSIPAVGNWVVTGAYSKTITITTDGETQSVTFYALKTFATATDQEIADMVSEADLGYLDLYDDAGWRVGQEHQISLSSINSSGTYDGVSWAVGESQSAQNVTLVLLHHGLYELVSSVLDTNKQTRTTCSFVVGLKDCLNTKGYINSTANVANIWKDSDRRNWCNSGFRGAIPSTIRSAFKQFKTITESTHDAATTITVNDYFTLAAEGENVDAVKWGNTAEGAAVTLFDYYSTSANRAKKVNGTTARYWARTAHQDYVNPIIIIKEDGTSSSDWSNADYGISPFGCL